MLPCPQEFTGAQHQLRGVVGSNDDAKRVMTIDGRTLRAELSDRDFSKLVLDASEVLTGPMQKLEQVCLAVERIYEACDSMDP